MFGFWFWVLTPVVLVLVVAFVYDRRHNARIKSPQEAPAAGGEADARAAIRHRVHDEHWGTGI